MPPSSGPTTGAAATRHICGGGAREGGAEGEGGCGRGARESEGRLGRARGEGACGRVEWEGAEPPRLHHRDLGGRRGRGPSSAVYVVEAVEVAAVEAAAARPRDEAVELEPVEQEIVAEEQVVEALASSLGSVRLGVSLRRAGQGWGSETRRKPRREPRGQTTGPTPHPVDGHPGVSWASGRLRVSGTVSVMLSIWHRRAQKREAHLWPV